MPGSSLSPDEERLAKDWKINDNMAPSKIAGLLRRDKSTITRLLKRTVPRKKRGPKLMLTEAQVDALVAKVSGRSIGFMLHRLAAGGSSVNMEKV